MNLTNPKTVRELLEKYNLAPQKGFGQNFLINPDVPRRIAGSSAEGCDCGAGGAERCAPEGVCALEIGPGLGTMTGELCELYDNVLAVEIDKGLIPLLGETLAEYDNVTVVNGDFLKMNLQTLIKEHFGTSPVRICANLPYYITTPIIMAVLEAYKPSESPQVQSLTLLVQSEVADRLCAEAGSSEYGSITAAVALAGKAKRLFTVSPGSFYPAPKVTSAVVQIELYRGGAKEAFPDLPKDNDELDSFIAGAKKLVSEGFAKRRKTLTNALSGIVAKEKCAAALKEMGLREDIRGEKLSAADFVKLYALIQK